jgi:hypothetical protein
VSRDLAFQWTVSVPGSSKASVIHSIAAVALAIAIVGVAGASQAQKFGAQVMHRDLSGMPNLNPTTSCRSRAIVSRFHQLWAFPERCPRMTCSTNSSPNRLVNGPERNKKR